MGSLAQQAMRNVGLQPALEAAKLGLDFFR